MRTRIVAISVLGVIVVVAVWLGILWPAELLRSPLSRDIPLVYPSFASMDEAGNVLVIDESLRRVSKFDPEGGRVFEIRGGDRRPGHLFSAVELATDVDGSVFILNQVVGPEGFSTVREEVLRFGPGGEARGVVFSRGYSDVEIDNHLVNRGRLTGLAVRDGTLSFFELGPDGAVMHLADTRTLQGESRVVVRGLDTAVWLSSIARDSVDGVVYVTKSGEVRHESRGGRDSLLFRSTDLGLSVPDEGLAGQAGEVSVPWWVGVDAGGLVYVSDLTRSRIVCFDRHRPLDQAAVMTNQAYQAATGDGYPYIYYSFSVLDDGSVVSSHDSAVVVADSGGRLVRVFKGGRITLQTLVVRWVLWFGLAAALVLVLVLANLVWVAVGRRRLSLILRQVLILLPLVVGILGFVVAVLVASFTERFETQEINTISLAIQLLSQVVDTERLARIKGPAQFMDEDYVVVRDQLHQALNRNRDPWDSKLYFALHHTFQNKLYTLMYLNDGVGPLHPFGYLNDPTNAYWRAMTEGLTTGKAADQWGTWVFGVGPVFGKDGEIVALLEVGRDQFSFSKGTEALLGGLVPFVVGGFFILVLSFILVSWLFLSPLRRFQGGSAGLGSGVDRIFSEHPTAGSRDGEAGVLAGFDRMSGDVRSYVGEVIALGTRKGGAGFGAVREGIGGPRPSSGTLTLLVTGIRSGSAQSGGRMSRQDTGFQSRWLGLLGHEVRNFRGWIERYVGDALVALFPEGPDDAIQTAVAVLSLVDVVNQDLAQQGRAPCHVGMGIHGAGPVRGQNEPSQGTGAKAASGVATTGEPQAAGASPEATAAGNGPGAATRADGDKAAAQAPGVAAWTGALGTPPGAATAASTPGTYPGAPGLGAAALGASPGATTGVAASTAALGTPPGVPTAASTPGTYPGAAGLGAGSTGPTAGIGAALGPAGQAPVPQGTAPGNTGTWVRAGRSAQYSDDPADSASRIETLTWLFHTPILVSEGSMELIRTPNRYLFRHLGRVCFKDPECRIGLYEILDGLPADIKVKKLLSQDDLARGIDHFQGGRWAEAYEAFSGVLAICGDDVCAKLYAQRCREALNGAPTGDWQGCLVLGTTPRINA